MGKICILICNTKSGQDNSIITHKLSKNSNVYNFLSFFYKELILPRSDIVRINFVSVDSF